MITVTPVKRGSDQLDLVTFDRVVEVNLSAVVFLVGVELSPKGFNFGSQSLRQADELL